MDYLRKVGTVAVAVLSLAFIAGVCFPRAAHAVANMLVQVTNTSANPVPSNEVNKLPSREVTLELVLTQPNAWAQIFPDGSSSSGVFTIPAGQAFVLTDYSWVADETDAPNSTYVISLVNKNNTEVDEQGGVLDGNGIAFGSAHLNTGIAFTDSGNPHFVEINLGFTTGNIEVHHMVLHGYMTPNQWAAWPTREWELARGTRVLIGIVLEGVYAGISAGEACAGAEVRTSWRLNCLLSANPCC